MGRLKQTDSEQYAIYKTRYENGGMLKTDKNKRQRNYTLEKEQYIQEHPELDIEELRKEAKIRMYRSRFRMGLFFSLPPWITEENAILSLERLTISDLITSSGKLPPRDTIIRRCIRKAVAEGRVDEDKLRNSVLSQFENYYRKELILLRSPNLYVPVQRLIKYEASIEELAVVMENWCIDVKKFVRLINKKDLKELTDEEMRALEQERKKKKKKRKKKRFEARLKIKKKQDVGHDETQSQMNSRDTE